MQYSETVAVNSTSRAGRSAAETTDAALVEAIATGDRHALQLLYGRHHVKVYRFALRFVRDEAAAEDMVSEVFLDVWRQAERFERRCQVATWLLAICRNKALSSLRRRTGEQLDDDVAEFIEDPADNPEVLLQKQERINVLRSCLEKLSPAHREIVDLVYYHERTIEEISEIISVPVNTVKTRMFYARKRIAELMADKGIERHAI